MRHRYKAWGVFCGDVGQAEHVVAGFERVACTTLSTARRQVMNTVPDDLTKLLNDGIRQDGAALSDGLRDTYVPSSVDVLLANENEAKVQSAPKGQRDCHVNSSGTVSFCQSSPPRLAKRISILPKVF